MKKILLTGLALTSLLTIGATKRVDTPLLDVQPTQAQIVTEPRYTIFEGVSTQEVINAITERYRALEKAVERPWTEQDVIVLAKMVYGEGNAVSRDEQKLIVWTALNRVDYYGESIEAIVTAPDQFHGYFPEQTYTPEIVEMVEETLEEWYRGENALILPPYSYTSEYLFFEGDLKNNYFREVY